MYKDQVLNDAQLKEDYLIAFWGNNSSYYHDKWLEMKSGGSMVSWNWAAFFLSFFWFPYRKMYDYSACCFLLHFWSIYVKISSDNPFLRRLPAYLIALLSGLFGNYLYYLHTRQKIKRVLCKHQSEDAILIELKKKGGHSILSAVSFMLILVMLLFIPEILKSLANLAGHLF